MLPVFFCHLTQIPTQINTIKCNKYNATTNTYTIPTQYPPTQYAPTTHTPTQSPLFYNPDDVFINKQMPINTRDTLPPGWERDDDNYRVAHSTWKGPPGEATVVDKVH